MRNIPLWSVQVQTGLYAKAEILTLGNTTRTYYDLYSVEGYCFYLPENNLDEHGDLLPENERTYYQYMSTAYQSEEEINANVVSVVRKEDYVTA